MASKKRSSPKAVSPRPPQASSGPPSDPLSPIPAEGARAQPAPDSNANLASSIALTDETCDLVAELSEMFKAYLALERFVSPEYEDEGQANVAPSRAELGAMIHAINVAIQRLTRALMDTTTTLQKQIAVGR